MTRVVNVHEAKTHLSQLLEDVRAGEEIILAKAGRPYARLVPLDQAARRETGFLPGAASLGDEVLDSLDPDELDRYEGDL